MNKMGEWRWFGKAAHLIVGEWCRFHMATLLPNGYLVSTVGEYWPERAVREIHAKVRDPQWLAANRELLGDMFDAAYMERFGYQEIGLDRKYETMVFVAGKPCTEPSCNCGVPAFNPQLDSDAYNTAGQATEGHMAMCRKWALKKPR